MKKRISALTLALAVTAGAAQADPLAGRWLTAPDDNGNFGMVEVAPCGPALCGTLTSAYDSAGKPIQSPNVGRQLIWDTKPDGGGIYRGKVYAPDRKKTYKSKLVLDGDRLSVSGCVFGICREGGVWRRQK
jgi:uncharacterized protein (DUF2147 family)